VIFVRVLLDGKSPEKIVYDVKCSAIVREVVEERGGVPLVQKSGHGFLKAALLKEGAVFGGEISGHYFFRVLGGDDSLFASLFFAEIVAKKKKRLSQLVDDIPGYFTTPDIRVPCDPGRGREVLDGLWESFQRDKVTRLDGVRVEFADGWILARLSVTEPLLTMRAEAKTQERLEEIMALLLSALPDDIEEKARCQYQR
jgi:phosphomannomutase/phosphoglucomutase